MVAQQSWVADVQVSAPHTTVPAPPPLDDPLPASLSLALASFVLASFVEEEPAPESRSGFVFGLVLLGLGFVSGSSSEGSSRSERPPQPGKPNKPNKLGTARMNRPVEIVARMDVSPNTHGR
jgi:hypothetical protein